MDVSMESIGERIKTRRKELQLTQTDIFEMCGIRSGALSRIENGTSVPSVILFYRIAEVLQCDMNWLMTGVSSNMKNEVFSEYEEELLNGFRQLDQDDQEELMGLLALKLRKVKRDGEKMATLSNSDDGEVSDKLA